MSRDRSEIANCVTCPPKTAFEVGAVLTWRKSVENSVQLTSVTLVDGGEQSRGDFRPFLECRNRRNERTESAALCDEMAKKSYGEQTEMLLSFPESEGARRLLDAMIRVTTPPGLFLTLAIKDNDSDTLRPYLEAHCNLEGTKGRKSWSRVRTVMENFQRWVISLVNTDNTRNAPTIQARENRDLEQARAQGRTVEELHPGGWSGYQNER